jgi:cell division cycle 20-like protein 1, cofactor of APC complex
MLLLFTRCKRVRTFQQHRARVGTMTWNAHTLTTGSRDRYIYHFDVRAREPFSSRLIGHRQEVCGLQWSPDGQHLASGGNDNHLLLWDARSSAVTARFTEHAAAVKAIAWSPHQVCVLGAWCLVLGAWCLVLGAWCLVLGAWCLVCDRIKSTS